MAYICLVAAGCRRPVVCFGFLPRFTLKPNSKLVSGFFAMAIDSSPFRFVVGSVSWRAPALYHSSTLVRFAFAARLGQGLALRHARHGWWDLPWPAELT